MTKSHDFDREGFPGVVKKLAIHGERPDLVIALVHDLEHCALRWPVGSAEQAHVSKFCLLRPGGCLSNCQGHLRALHSRHPITSASISSPVRSFSQATSE